MATVAVLADIHGNLPALSAVLATLDRERPDAIVLAGDLAAGPLVVETLKVLRERPEEVHWIAGNCEREAVAAFDGRDGEHDALARWGADHLDPPGRDEMASWPPTLVVDGVRYCHGSPRRDDEILTSRTPDDVFGPVLAEVAEEVVVGGHTHHQYIRHLPGGRTFANAGSVGLPYEGQAAAFWMTVRDGRPESRRTSYDVDDAFGVLRSTGMPGLEDLLDGSLVDPYAPAWVEAYYEHLAGRAGDPGPPRREG